MRLLLIFCFCFGTNYLLSAQSKFDIKKGVLDLRSWDFEKEKFISLDGEWEFYWKEFLVKKSNSYSSNDKVYIYAPKSWTFVKKHQPYPSKGYATYCVKVLLPSKLNKDLALKMPTLSTAYKLYFNNELLYEVGKTAKSARKAIPAYHPLLVPLKTSHLGSFALSIQVSNYHHRKAGVWEPIELGTRQNISIKRERSLMISLFLVGSISIMALYHFGLFILRTADKSTLFFGLSCIAIVLRILSTNDYFLLQITPLSFFWLKKIEYCSAFFFMVFFMMFFSEIFKKEINKRVVRLNTLVMLSMCLADLILPSYYATFLIIPFQFMLFAVSSYALFVLIRVATHKHKGAKVFLAGSLVLFATMLNDILHVEDIIDTGLLSAYGFFIFIFSQAFLISQRFSVAFKTNLIFSRELDKANQRLEQKVRDRTKDLQYANRKLQSKNIEILQTQEKIVMQRDFLDEQNSQLQYQHKQIQSSIKAAEAIQQAIAPDAKKLEKLLGEYFIINKPKAVVSGDFYWINEIKNKTVLVVGDCTGHGVPGAFMTLIGHNILDKIVRLRKITNPASILAILNEEVQNALRQTETGNNSGMDIVVTTLEKEDNKVNVTFSGAKNNLIYFDKEQHLLEELKGTRKSVGGLQNRKTSFVNKTVCLPKGSLIYVGSDGWEDQNNNKRKKFGKLLLLRTIENVVRLPLVEQKQRIEARMAEYMQGTTQRDDILWIGIKV